MKWLLLNGHTVNHSGHEEKYSNLPILAPWLFPLHDAMKSLKKKLDLPFCVKIHIHYYVNICQIIDKTIYTSSIQLVGDHIFIISLSKLLSFPTLDT